MTSELQALESRLNIAEAELRTIEVQYVEVPEEIPVDNTTQGICFLGILMFAFIIACIAGGGTK